MKKIMLLTVVSMLSVSAIACSTCGCQAKAEAKKVVPAKAEVVFISKAEFLQMKKTAKNLVIIDVLSSKSFAKAHIEGAISIPLAKLSNPAVLKGLDKSKTYVVYCASAKCNASVAGAEILLKNGFTKVYDYKAGLAGWKAAKLPLKTAKLCKCGAVKGSPSCCK